METVPNVNNTMMELVVNREATGYIEKNYNELVRMAITMGAAPEKAEDALHTMYILLFQQETDGQGYNMYKGRSDSIISVQQFVLGRLKRYCKNELYQKDTVSAKVDSHGNIKYKEVSACSDGGDVEGLNEFQVAYNFSASYDDIEDIENSQSVLEEIQYLLTFENALTISMKVLLSEISNIAENVDKIDISLFKEIRTMGDEFAEAFKSVVKFAGKHPDRYKTYLLGAFSN